MKITARIRRKKEDYTNKNILWFLLNFREEEFQEFLEDIYCCGYNDGSKLQFHIDTKKDYENVDDIVDKYHEEEYSFDLNWLNSPIDDDFFTQDEIDDYFRFLENVRETAFGK